MTRLQLPPARTLPAARAADMRRMVCAQVSAKSRRRPLLIAGGIVVLGAGATAAGFAFVPHVQPVTDKNEARCYTVPSLSAGPTSFTTVGAAAPAGSHAPAQVEDALGICSALWRQGFVKAGPQGAAGPAKPNPAGVSSPVPSLVACVLPDGTAAIFPGPASTCAALGLPTAKS